MFFQWNDSDLLKIESRDVYAYGRALLDILFTKQEQRTSILIESKKSNKGPLDKERVKIIIIW